MPIEKEPVQIMEVPGHGTIEMDKLHGSKTFAELTDRVPYQASSRISILKEEYKQITGNEITGTKLEGNPRELFYTPEEILLLVKLDDMLKSRSRRKTKKTHSA